MSNLQKPLGQSCGDEKVAKSCPAGHVLLYYVRDIPGANFCNRCKRRGIQPPEHIFRCKDCDYDLCAECYRYTGQPNQSSVALQRRKVRFNDQEENAIGNLQKPLAQLGGDEKAAKSCPVGHALLYYVRDIPGANFCDRCKRRGIQPPEHIFRCKDCDYDLCAECYCPADQDKDTTPLVKADPWEIAKVAGSVCFFIDLNDTMIGSFFATWFYKRGLTGVQLGTAWFLMAFGLLCTAPLVPKLIEKYSPNKVQIYGSWFFIITRVAISLAPFMPVNWLHFLLSIVFLFQGMAYAIAEISASTWVLRSVEPEQRIQASAILVQTRGAAALIAPVFGGVLYDIGEKLFPVVGSYFLPMATGCTLFAIQLVKKHDLVFSLDPPASRNIASKSGSILRHPAVVAVNIFQFFIWCFLCAGVVIFQPMFYFTYHVPSTVYGVIACLGTAFWITGAMLSQAVVSALGEPVAFMVCQVSVAFGCLWYGPTPVLAPLLPAPGPWTVWQPLIGIFFSNTGLGVCLTAALPLIFKYNVEAGWSESDAAAQTGMLQIMNTGIAIGIGPFTGACLSSSIGVPKMCMWFAIWFVTVSMLAPTFLLLWERQHPKQKNAVALAS